MISDENTVPGLCVSFQIIPVEATTVVDARTAKSVWLIFVEQTLTSSDGITNIALIHRTSLVSPPLQKRVVRRATHRDDNSGINIPRTPSCPDVPGGESNCIKISEVI